MSVHARVTDEPAEPFLEFVSGSRIPRGRTRPESFLIVKRGSKYRVHEDASSYSYSGPTAAHVKLGPMVRRYDPDAGLQEGRPATFTTPQEAEAYVKTWL
jgi:hypothetical protein